MAISISLMLHDIAKAETRYLEYFHIIAMQQTTESFFEQAQGNSEKKTIFHRYVLVCTVLDSN